jgi:hypothetical protein
MLGTHFPFPIPKVSFFSFNFIIHSFGWHFIFFFWLGLRL